MVRICSRTREWIGVWLLSITLSWVLEISKIIWKYFGDSLLESESQGYPKLHELKRTKVELSVFSRGTNIKRIRHYQVH